MKRVTHEATGATERNRVNIFPGGFSCASWRVPVPACANLRPPFFDPPGSFKTMC